MYACEPTSDADRFHVGFRITRASGDAVRRNFIQPLQIRVGQPDFECIEVLIEIRAPLGARDRHQVFAL